MTLILIYDLSDSGTARMIDTSLRFDGALAPRYERAAGLRRSHIMAAGHLSRCLQYPSTTAGDC